MVRHEKGKWRFRKQVTALDGSKIRVFGTRSTKEAAEKAEREEIRKAERAASAQGYKAAKAGTDKAPTLEDWFTGRFWKEWVEGRNNKPSEKHNKKMIFRRYLKDELGSMRIDQIDTAAVARIRAKLGARRTLGAKTINNALCVLSKSLRYAEDVGLIVKAPRVGLLKAERPETPFWEIEQYAQVVAAAAQDEVRWLVSVCLAGEAGLRAGEIRELRWQEDVDMTARTLTVKRQNWKGQVGTPKGSTRRTVPMTQRLFEALRSMSVVRTGLVVCNSDRSAVTDGQQEIAHYRIYARAGLPKRARHILRHSFATHAAGFGVNPFTLMSWLGHKRLDETLGYVHGARAHARPIPSQVLEAGRAESDPDRRIVAMLGARGNQVAMQCSGEGRSASGTAG